MPFAIFAQMSTGFFSFSLNPSNFTRPCLGVGHFRFIFSYTLCALSVSSFRSFYFIFIYLFIFKISLIDLFLAALGLCCRAQAFSSCSERGLLFVAVRGLLIAVASLVAEHRL